MFSCKHSHLNAWFSRYKSLQSQQYFDDLRKPVCEFVQCTSYCQSTKIFKILRFTSYFQKSLVTFKICIILQKCPLSKPYSLYHTVPLHQNCVSFRPFSILNFRSTYIHFQIIMSKNMHYFGKVSPSKII